MIPTWLKPLAAGVAATLCLIVGVVVAGRVASGALDAAGTTASAPGQGGDPAERLRLAPSAVTAAPGRSGGGGLAAPAPTAGGVLGAGPGVAAATPAGVAPGAAVVPPALVPSPSTSPSSPRRTARLIDPGGVRPQRPAPATGATAPEGAAAVSGPLPSAAVAARLRIRVAEHDVDNQLGDGVLRLRMAISQESGTAVALPGDLDLRLAVDPQTVAAARERAADGPVALAARIDVHRPDAGEGAPELRVQLRVVTGTAAPEETAVKPGADDPAALSNAIEVVVPLPDNDDARRPGDGGPGGAPPAAGPPDAGAPPGALSAAVIQISLPIGPATSTVGTSGVGVPVVTSAGGAPDLEVAVTLGPSVDAPAGAPTPTTPPGGDGGGPSGGAGDGTSKGDGPSDGDGAGDGTSKGDGPSKGDGAGDGTSKGDGSGNGDDGDGAGDAPGESGEPEDAPTAQPMTTTPPASPSTAVSTTATGTSPAAAEPQPVGTTPASSGPGGTASASTAPEIAGSAPEAGVASTPSDAGTAPGDDAPDDDDC